MIRPTRKLRIYKKILLKKERKSLNIVWTIKVNDKNGGGGFYLQFSKLQKHGSKKNYISHF